MPTRKLLIALAILLTGIRTHAEINTDEVRAGEMSHWAGDFQSIVGLHYTSMGYAAGVTETAPGLIKYATWYNHITGIPIIKAQ